MDPPRGACLLGDKITPSGQKNHPDRCTECTCANSTVVCTRETCPPLDCPVEKQTFSSHNQCCPQCPRTIDKSDTCQENGKIYMVIIDCCCLLLVNVIRVLYTRSNTTLLTSDNNNNIIIIPFGFSTETVGRSTNANRVCVSAAKCSAPRNCVRRSPRPVRPT